MEKYAIDEKQARIAKSLNSFDDYKTGSTTAAYNNELKEVEELEKRLLEKFPNRKEEIERLANRYSYGMAKYFNQSSIIDSRCPSVMICGPANFPVRKKEQQNAARSKNFEYYNYLQTIKNKLENMVYGSNVVKSNDKNAVELLEEKLEKLQKLQVEMKQVNAYYKKNGTLEGCDLVTEKEILDFNDCKARGIISRPFEGYSLTNNNAKIKNTAARIERLKKIKEAPTETVESEHFKVVRNTEEVRLQILFEDKPSEETRSILKSHGFRWSPKNMAWQRLLNGNSEYALKTIIDKI